MSLFMRRFYFLTALLGLFWLSASAALKFDSQTRYRIVCQILPQGCLVLGQNHGSTALLYHTSQGATPDDGWWYIAPGEKGYTLRNAATNEYIMYDTERVEDTKKGASLSATLQGAATEWLIKEMDCDCVFKSVVDPTQWFNLRHVTSLLGTYTGSGTNNERFSIYDEFGNKVNQGDEKPQSGEWNLAESLDYMSFSDKRLIYEKGERIYYFPLPDVVREGEPFHFNLTYKLKDETRRDSLVIDELFTHCGNNVYDIKNPQCDQDYNVALINAQGDTIARSLIRFTYLPVVEINLDVCSSSYYVNGRIRVTDGNTFGYDSLYHANFKYRGNTSLRYEKKSFNIKLKDEAGNSIDRSFFGLRTDNRWILDAMMIDRSCMRNRVAMDLWNDFATPPYYGDSEPKARTGTRGKFVEVFWNNTYHGLFCMSERIDRKQLDIKKFVPASLSAKGEDEVHGVLYKGKEWGYEVFMGHYLGTEFLPGTPPQDYTNQLGVERWCNYDFKYPDYEKEAVEWEPLYNAVNFVATSNQEEFDRGVMAYFDYPVLLDYYLFLEFLLAGDNHGKNIFYFCYDIASIFGKKISLAPWDLDAVLGVNWEADNTNTTPDRDLDEYILQFEHGQNAIYIKLRDSKVIDWMGQRAQRYAELRPTFFSEESFVKRITDYADLFASSGAGEREEQRWGSYHSDLQGGAYYMANWITERIKMLDVKYGYDPVVSITRPEVAETHLRVYGGENVITVVCNAPRTILICNMAGQVVLQVKAVAGENHIPAIPSGIYLVNGQKVVVK